MRNLEKQCQILVQLKRIILRAISFLFLEDVLGMVVVPSNGEMIDVG